MSKFKHKMFGWFSESMAKKCGCITWIDMSGNEVQVTTVVPANLDGDKRSVSNWGDEVLIGEIIEYSDGSLRSWIDTYVPLERKPRGKKKVIKRKKS
jgi:hypothetical protein